MRHRASGPRRRSRVEHPVADSVNEEPYVEGSWRGGARSPRRGHGDAWRILALRGDHSADQVCVLAAQRIHRAGA